MRVILPLLKIFLFSFIVVLLINRFFSPLENCTALGNTLYVDDSGGADYTDIQDAIDAASEGDTIYVYAGTYNSIEINGGELNQITLVGENKDNTIINGGGSGHVVRAYETQVSGNTIEIHISGFTITNAGGNGFDCISLSYAENCTIISNKIINGDVGEGIQIDHGSEIIIQDNSISNCQGSGISLTISNNNIIENNLIQNNQKGIQLSSTSNNNVISNNTISSNSQYGTYLIQSINNIFYRNDFTNNDQNAQDSLANNWYYGTIGNYWDDYNGYDNNSDDIGDIPYDIPGGTNQDNYPLGYFKVPEDPGGGNQKPVAHLPTISPNPANSGESILFSGSGSDDDGFIEGYDWRSNLDGQLSTQNTFSSSSLSIGTHIIYFKVKDNDGDWSSEKTVSLIVNPSENQIPLAFIDSIIPNPSEVGKKVYFIGHGTDDGVITGWKWFSNIDGEMSNKKTFETINLSIGTHTIFFQVMDNNNEWSERDTEIITIYNGTFVPTPYKPVANAGGPYSSSVNEEILFDGSSSYDDGIIVDFNWDFGDGNTGKGESKLYSYSIPGNYSIILTVTDEDGNISTDTTYVNIIHSVNNEGEIEGSSGIEINVPFPIMIAIEIFCIITIIVFFFLWLKRK